jgi:hypothetical protein
MRGEKCLLERAVGEESFHIRGQKGASDAGVLTADRESSNDRLAKTVAGGGPSPDTRDRFEVSLVRDPRCAATGGSDPRRACG